MSWNCARASRKSQIATEAGYVNPNMLAMIKNGSTTAFAIEAIFGTIVTRNEVAWLEEIRDASGHSDPNLTVRSRIALRAVFGK